MALSACSSKPRNPLLGEFHTPFGTPQFDRIRVEHYRPAVEYYMQRQQDSIAAIPKDPDPASFANTFKPLEVSGMYIRAEVLDADAFQAFKETSLFDSKSANSFRKHILAAGGSEEEMELYKKFRGREPKIEPLLQRRGSD